MASSYCLYGARQSCRFMPKYVLCAVVGPYYIKGGLLRGCTVDGWNPTKMLKIWFIDMVACACKAKKASVMVEHMANNSCIYIPPLCGGASLG
jgi:hypothetical protein